MPPLIWQPSWRQRSSAVLTLYIIRRRITATAKNIARPKSHIHGSRDSVNFCSHSYLWPWLGHSLTTTQCVMHFRFWRWRHFRIKCSVYIPSSSSSFYLHNNTAVCTFSSIQFWKSRRATSDKNTNSCHKTCNTTVTGYTFYHTSKILQTGKLEKSIFSMLFLTGYINVKNLTV